MIGRLNHVAIAVPDLESGIAVYRNTLGAHVTAPEAIPEHGVTVVFVELPNTKVELLEPLGDSGFGNGFTKCWHADFSSHLRVAFLSAGQMEWLKCLGAIKGSGPRSDRLQLLSGGRSSSRWPVRPPQAVPHSAGVLT